MAHHIEYSLLFFTLLSQMAVGLTIFLFIFDIAPSSDSVRHTKNLKNIPLCAAGCMAVALFASLFHLGKPFEGYRAAYHWYSSWLSREVIIFGAFFGLLIIYAWLWQKEGPAPLRISTGFIVTQTGLAGVFSSAKIYMTPAHPAWNSGYLVLTFFAATLSLGLTAALFSAAFLKMARYLEKAAKACMILGMARLIVGLMQSSFSCNRLVGLSVFEKLPSALWVYVSVSSLILASLPMLLLSRSVLNYIKTDNADKALHVSMLIFFLTLIGEALGRAVMYMSAAALPIG